MELGMEYSIFGDEIMKNVINDDPFSNENNDYLQELKKFDVMMLKDMRSKRLRGETNNYFDDDIMEGLLEEIKTIDPDFEKEPVRKRYHEDEFRMPYGCFATDVGYYDGASYDA